MKVVSPQSLYCIVIVKTKEKVLTFVWLFYFFKYVDISTITAAYCSAKWHFGVTGGKIHVMTTFQKLLVLAPFMMLMLCVMYKQMNKKFQCHHIFDLLLLIHITEYRWAKIFPNTSNPSKSIYLCDTNKIDFFRKTNFHLFLSDGPVRIKQEEMGNVLDFLGSLTFVCWWPRLLSIIFCIFHTTVIDHLTDEDFWSNMTVGKVQMCKKFTKLLCILQLFAIFVWYTKNIRKGSTLYTQESQRRHLQFPLSLYLYSFP